MSDRLGLASIVQRLKMRGIAPWHRGIMPMPMPIKGGALTKKVKNMNERERKAYMSYVRSFRRRRYHKKH